MIEVGFLRLVPRTSTAPYYTLFQQKKHKTDALYPMPEGKGLTALF